MKLSETHWAIQKEEEMSKKAQRFLGHTDGSFHEPVFLVYARELAELEEDVERLWEALGSLAYLEVSHPHLWNNIVQAVYEDLAKDSFSIKNIKMDGGKK